MLYLPSMFKCFDIESKSGTDHVNIFPIEFLHNCGFSSIIKTPLKENQQLSLGNHYHNNIKSSNLA